METFDGGNDALAVDYGISWWLVASKKIDEKTSKTVKRSSLAVTIAVQNNRYSYGSVIHTVDSIGNRDGFEST